MLNLEHITTTPDAWDAFLHQQADASVLQQSAWATLKEAYGWRSSRVTLAKPGTQEIVSGAQLLYRPLPLRLGTMAYLPRGPISTSPDDTQLWAAIHQQARQNKAVFLKWEPNFSFETPAPDPAALGFTASPQTVQPPRTIMIDLRGDDDAILARMNQGTRRKIRQSQKNDIRYYHAPREGITAFNQIMQTTGSRNEFGVHEPAYYELAYDLFVPQGDATLILAEHEGDVLAGIMVFALNNVAWYLYGASSNVKRNLMATYGIQWAAIQWAKARGCDYYDLWGVPDEDLETLEAQFQERSDGLWGVYGFKRGWGGQLVRYNGAWDYPYNSLLYQAYRQALKWRS